MTKDLSGGLADSDHRLLSRNPSGCAEVSQLYECLKKGGLTQTPLRED
jgi:hypothetical protein